MKDVRFLYPFIKVFITVPFLGKYNASFADFP